MQYVYEPQYFISGWFDDSSRAMQSWFDRDITATNGIAPNLDILEPVFFDNENTIFTPPPITVELTASFYDDPDLIFVPMAVRALGPPDQLLRNEVRRIR